MSLFLYLEEKNFNSSFERDILAKVCCNLTFLLIAFDLSKIGRAWQSYGFSEILLFD